MMRQELVHRRRWINDERFADLLGAVNLIPGPNSTELAIYLGFLRAGWPGLLAAGVCFIGPAMLIVLALAWAYVRFGATPQVTWLLYGIKPVVIAIIAQSLVGLGRTVLRGALPIVVALAAALLYLLGVHPLALLAGGGVMYATIRFVQRHGRPGAGGHSLALLLAGARWGPRDGLSGLLAAAAVPISLLTLFLTFLKIGAVLYGSGYVLLAFLRADFVHQLGWLTDRQILDAVSVGQFTPGPVFTTATFVGYLVGGLPGALLATLGIFLPAFIFVPLVHRLATRLRRAPLTAPVLDGVNVVALALMGGVVVQLTQSALVDPLTWGLSLVALAVLLRFQLNSVWLILGGALVGFLARGL
jgi:chromate transporter